MEKGSRAESVRTIVLIDRLPWRHNANDVPLGLLSLAQIGRNANREIFVFPLPIDPNTYVFHFEHLLKALSSGPIPQLIGLSSICSTYPYTLRLAMMLRESFPHAWIILGGPHATGTAADTIAAISAIDMIIKGEAERSFPALIEVIETNQHWAAVPGLVYRADGDIHETPPAPLIPDFDSLLMLDYSLVGGLLREKKVPIEAGRGCPFSCSFCSTSRFFGRTFRLKSPRRLIDEMDAINQQWGATSFDLVHDFFMFSEDIVSEFCRLLLEKRRNYTWGCSARPDFLTPEILQLLSAAGCKGMYLGLETASDRMQVVIGKNLSPRSNVEILEEAKRGGISTTASFIIGFPEEREEDVLAALEAILDILMSGKPMRDQTQLHILTPLPDTAVLEQNKNRLRFDGFASDFAVSPGSEEEWLIQQNLKLMPQFQYIENDSIPRKLYRACFNFFALAPNFRRTLREWKNVVGSTRSLVRWLFEWLAISQLSEYRIVGSCSDRSLCLAEFGRECLQASEKLGLVSQPALLHEFCMTGIALASPDSCPWVYVDLGNYCPAEAKTVSHAVDEKVLGLSRGDETDRWFAFYSKKENEEAGCLLSHIQLMPISVEALGSAEVGKVARRIMRTIRKEVNHG